MILGVFSVLGMIGVVFISVCRLKFVVLIVIRLVLVIMFIMLFFLLLLIGRWVWWFF